MLQRRNVQPNYDIMVWAAAGYDGVVRVNGADFQLTNEPGTELWYGTAPSSVTAMDYFMKHNSTTNYNSTSVYIKKVKFGTGMFTKTASCTTLSNAFSCGGTSDSSIIEKIDVTNLNTSNVTSMASAFNRCGKETSNPGVVIKGIEDWDTSSVTNASNMFNICRIKGGYLDLHKWRIPSTSADLGGMFGNSAEIADAGINTCFYYTPAYWGKEYQSSYGAAHFHPVVYPYHDFTAAATDSFDGTININNSNVTMTKDSTLGIWYYDLPSGTTITSLQSMLETTSAKSYVRSFSISDKFDEVNIGTFFGAFRNCEALRTVRIPGLITTGVNQTFNNTSGTSRLFGIFGFDKLLFSEEIIYGGEQTFRGCSDIRFIDMSAVTYGTTINYYFNGCTNLRRISNMPGLASTVGGSAVFTGCTSLTTIDNSGPISKSIDLSPCPLTLSSAKVILNSLQTVTSETITFSTTTLGYIFQDDDALELVRQAKLKGWNVANANRLITGTVASGVSSIKLRINNNSAKDVTVTCTNGRFAYNVTESITTIRNILSQSSGQITSIDFSNCDLSTCTAAINTFLNQTVLTKISLKGCDTSNITNWQGCFATNTGTSAIQEIDFRGCTFSSSITNVQYLFMNATALTTFKTDSNTSILQNWDMSPCSSLTLASAKNVMRALGTISGKTAAFHANTITLINNDTEALRLAAMARQRGWTISSVNLYGDIRFKVTDSATSMSFKINASAYNDPDNVTVTKDSDNWFRYTIPENVTLTSLCGAFNEKSNIDRIVLESTLPTANLTDINRFIRFSNNVKYLYMNCETGNVTNWARALNSNTTGDRLRSISINKIKNGSVTTNILLGQENLTEILTCDEISESMDFSPCPLNLASAKIVLQSLQTVTSETLTFSSTTKGYINADSEALALVTAARNKGWTISLS